MKKNLSILFVLMLFSTLSYGIDVVFTSGGYKGHESTAAGTKVRCSWNPWKDCYRTSCGGGGIILEFNGPYGWTQVRAVMRREDGTEIENPTMEQFIERRECGSSYDENGELVTSCIYNNVFIIE